MRTTKSLALAMAGLLLATTMAAAQPTEIRIGVALEPPALDPTAGAAEAIDVVVYQNIFEGLTRIDQNGAVQPGLAESWTISEDGLSYRFSLHDGVTFHDGTSFDAEDVKFTFDRLLAEDSVNAQKALYAPITAVTVIDPLTVEFTLSRPDGLFLFNLGRGDAVIVAPESADNNASEPIGTGPFAFLQWDRGSRVILEQYGPYWGDKPSLTKASYVFISDTATMTNALLAGDIDGTNNFAPEALAIFEGNPQFKVLVGSTEGETILATNNRKAPFDNLKVRQAIAHGLDRAEIIEGATYGYGVPIGTHFAPHHPYYLDLTNTYPYDPAAAKALLAEAGGRDENGVRQVAGFSRWIFRHAEAAAGGLCAAFRADHCQPTGPGGHQAGAHQCGVGAVVGRRVDKQGLRPDHREPCRALRHWHLCQSRLLLRL